MKKILIIWLILTKEFCVFCQDNESDICTPKINPVYAWIMVEDSDPIRRTWDSIYALEYPNAVQIPTYGQYQGHNLSSTRQFNCHGYAWHVSDGGDYRWIGYYPGNTDEQIYWTDGSYSQVGNPVYPGKVSWQCVDCDHSAITTSPASSGILISKWNRFPLMRHALNYSPYGSQGLKYYKLNLTVSGSSFVVCNSPNKTFTLNNAPTGRTINWSVAPSDKTTPATGIGSNASLHAYSSSVYGYCSITFSFTSCANAHYQITSNPFWVGKFEGTVVTGQIAVCPGTPYTYTAQVPGGHQSSYIYSWTWPSNWLYPNPINPYSYWLSIQTPQYNPQGGAVRVRINNDCGTPGYTGITVYPVSCGYFFSYSPNPADNSLTIETKNQTTGLLYDSGIPVEFEAILYDYSKNIVKEDFSKDNKIVFDVSNLKNGIYFLNIIDISRNYAVIKEEIVIQ
jgi:hypothetical protein